MKQAFSVRLVLICSFLLVFFASQLGAQPLEGTIAGPAGFKLRVIMADPLGSGASAAELQKIVTENLSFVPFIEQLPPTGILGGSKVANANAQGEELKRFQLAGADLLITTEWGERTSKGVQVDFRAIETQTGKRVCGNRYYLDSKTQPAAVADAFCADLLEAVTGKGDFFRSTLAFVKSADKATRNVWAVRPTGRELRQLTNIKGYAMSPSWSPDGRFVIFSHIDSRTHALGVWDSYTHSVQRIKFPGNTVIGPCFLPDNRVAVSLSVGSNPNIYLLDHVFKRERALVEGSHIDVSPSVDATGTLMSFTSNRAGGPQVFLKNLRSGDVRRITYSGGYNSDPDMSPDGTLIAFTRMTDSGHRIFVHDLVSNTERQISYGPGSDEQPAFAPDSYFIAFTSTRRGSKQIYLTTRHGGEARLIPTGAGDAAFPAWGILRKAK